MKHKYYLMDSDKVIKELSSDANNGLSSKSCKELLDKYGDNLLPQKKSDTIIEIFFSGLKDSIVILLIITTIVSLLIGEVIDAIVIFFIVILDLILGTIEEYHANKNADSLKNIIKYNVKVYRDGEEQVIDSSLLVPGDIVLMESGDKVSADMRIISCANLQVDESVLTGESVNVSKVSDTLASDVLLSERCNMLYAGTTIVTGRCQGIVVATGVKTIIGNVFDTVSKMKEEKSPLTIRMNKLSKQISKLLLLLL